MTYNPQVNDYVIWKRNGLLDQGWVYFVSEPIDNEKRIKNNWRPVARYVTIEVGVREKPECQYDKNNPHKYVHILLCCYENQWKELKFVKKRKSQYDDSIVLESKEVESGTTAQQNTHRGQ